MGASYSVVYLEYLRTRFRFQNSHYGVIRDRGSFNLTTLWANSSNNKWMIFFLIFPQKKALTFYANCLTRREFA